MSDRYHSSAIVCIMLVVFWQYVWLNPTSNNDLFWYHQLHLVKMIPAVQWLLLSKSQSSYDILFFFFSLSLSSLIFSFNFKAISFFSLSSLSGQVIQPNKLSGQAIAGRLGFSPFFLFLSFILLFLLFSLPSYPIRLSFPFSFFLLPK